MDLDVVVKPAIARPGIVVEEGVLHPLDVADWRGGFRRVGRFPGDGGGLGRLACDVALSEP